VSKENRSCGKEAEEAAAGFLESQGYRIILRNYKTRFAEIDIIAREKGVLCFVEVKSRSSQRFGLAQEAVTPAKQAKISRAALSFLKENNLMEGRSRFDVVAMSFSGGKEVFQLIRDAFTLSE
jgi:putative endonuclease